MSQQLYGKIKAAIEQAAIKLGKEPADVSKAEFLESVSEGPDDVSEWDIRKLGGFSAVKGVLFGAVDANPIATHGSRLIRNHQRTLDRTVGTEEFRRGAFLAQLKELVTVAPIRTVKAVKKKKTKKTTRTLQACISDTHFGCVIDPNEMAGANEFNPTIAARRLALFTDQVCSYKTHYRDTTDLVVQLNGDILAGIIHDQEWAVDLMTKQFHLALVLLAQSIGRMAQEFNSVRVVCQPGNHGRFMHKSSKGRATNKKWDNFETMLYLSLSWALRELHNIEWVIPEAPFAVYQAQGKNFFVTHGDTVINVGNPGNAISMKAINEQVNQFNAAAAVKIDALCVGHVHTPLTMLMESGCHIVVNGCLSGVDPFAQSIGIFANNPAQIMFETTPNHAVGDVRIVQLKEADNNAALDDIIEAPDGNF